MEKEPSLIIGFITALLSVLIGFGLKLSGEQKTLILILVGAAIPLIQALVTRYHVYTAESVQQAFLQPTNTTIEEFDKTLAKQEQ